MDVREEKKRLRKEFSEKRKSLSPHYRNRADELIFQSLISNTHILQASAISIYVSHHEEVDTKRFINWCLEQGKQVCIPLVTGHSLSLRYITRLDECVPGFKGILEPPPFSKEVSPNTVDAFVVLGIAFDKNGYRLGYGKGFTDRMLADIHAHTLGICYQAQLVEELPHESYDIPVSEVITEETMSALQQTDQVIYDAIEQEKVRQFEGLELIPSENYVSPAVLEAMGSILTNKYSEGYARHRYYGGNKHIDVVEQAAIDRAKALFNVEHVNVQPYSGSPANFAVYTALCEPGDPISGMSLLSGGHLTHGWKVSATAKYFNSHPYSVKRNGEINWKELETIAKEVKPKLIWCGGSAFPRALDWERFAAIADSVGSYLIADIAHIAGLVLGGVHTSPVPYAHVITTTTHKTLRGPRGAMIMVTKKGLEKDPELAQKIDKAIFPGLQGGPHNHTTAAIAVALEEASKPEFHTYAAQIVANAKAMADEFKRHNINMVSDGTDNHLILVDLSNIGPIGTLAEYAMDLAHMTCNKNTIPEDPSSPFYPSGIRVGTPALTSRNFKEEDMKQVARWIVQVIEHLKEEHVPTEPSARRAFIKDFKARAKQDPFYKKIGNEVKEFTKNFPIPGIEI